ncbi:energy transducer TonB [Steroidobacter sp.]|uniref:energy transducer TonB n=1 Tax=Steroidobacter sp. TaxID=1978227 RepID=UPI001A388918|nr:energy transducer TonB [Steroidobacter sp.]MBL8268289.1 energy transducer TonB [Steroidobacter sp.]
MATDTARVKLELASGKNEITAPFYETAQRKRKLPAPPDAVTVAAPAEPPVANAYVVDVPLAETVMTTATPVAPPEFAAERPVVARPPWIAFGVALIAVAVGVWWVMSQRIPAIDPAVVIARNLDDAQTAMADGRYTDPPERSAFHYYSTVLALDPTNADAMAGIDAIADRHLTNARVLLAEQRIAEAGVALEKARRVRPEHNGLAVLDTQWRAELRKILAAATVIATPAAVEPATKSTVSKKRESVPSESALAAAESAIQKVVREAAGAGPNTKTKAGARPVAADPAAVVADVAAITASLAAAPAVAQPEAVTPTATEASASTMAVHVPAATAEDKAGAVVAPVEEKASAALPPDPVVVAATRPFEPKLVKMVQPEYPQEAVIRGIEGWVDVSLQISPNGDVIDPRIEATSRGRMFNRSALAAVEQWKYEPRGAGANSERVVVRVQFRRSN